MAKSIRHFNVTRKNEVPDHPNFIIVSPRMKLYMKKNQEINNLYKRFVSDEDHSVFSVDESFLDVTASLTYFKCDTAYKLAKIIQRVIYNHMGLYVTIGIGENPLLAKLALDNEAKNAPGFVAEWRYEDVPKSLANLPSYRILWDRKSHGCSLKKLGIRSIYDLAHIEPYMLKERFGIMGLQLYAHSWGIDRSFRAKADDQQKNHLVIVRSYPKIMQIKNK